MSVGERFESILTTDTESKKKGSYEKRRPSVYSMPEMSKTFTLGASRSRRGRHRLSQRLPTSSSPFRQSFGLRMRNLLDQSE